MCCIICRYTYTCVYEFIQLRIIGDLPIWGKRWQVKQRSGFTRRTFGVCCTLAAAKQCPGIQTLATWDGRPVHCVFCRRLEFEFAVHSIDFNFWCWSKLCSIITWLPFNIWWSWVGSRGFRTQMLMWWQSVQEAAIDATAEAAFEAGNED